MRRRAVLSTLAVGTAQFSGCFGWAHEISDSTGTLVVENHDDTRHDLHALVTLTEQEVPHFERSFELSPSDEVTVSDIGDEERYEVTAELGTGETATDRWIVGPCGEVRFRVRISEDGKFYIRQLDHCD